MDERLVRRIASTPFCICTRLYFGAFCCSCSLPTFIMDERTLDIAATIVDPAYIRQGAQSLATRSAYFRKLVSQRRAPDDGWPEHVIEALLRDLAQMDSNNFDGSVGFGEREARIASPLVRRVPPPRSCAALPHSSTCRARMCVESQVQRRHFRLGHGIGRSGDIAAIQVRAGVALFASRLPALLTTGCVIAAQGRWLIAHQQGTGRTSAWLRAVRSSCSHQSLQTHS